MQIPTRIIGRKRTKYKTKNGIWRRSLGYECDNGEVYSSFSKIGDVVGMSYHSITARADRYGLTSPAVLYQGHITHFVLADLGVPESIVGFEKDEYPMSLCKRDGKHCDNWSDRLGQRLGLEGSGATCNPQDTNKCYKNTPPFVSLYTSPMAGVCTGWGV